MTSSSEHAAGGMDGLASDHGFLPSNKMERSIMDSMEGFEDEDGNRNTFLKAEDPDMPVFRQYRANTGVRGVQEDAKRHYAMFALQQRADAARRQEQVRRLMDRHGRMLQNTEPAPGEAEGEEDDDDDDFEDEEFLRYKLERLKQMQQLTQASAAMPTFGSVVRLDDVLQYPDAVDKVGCSTTYVVVHLHEEYLAPCVRLSCHLEQLAAKYDQVKFVEVCAHEAKETLDPAELPVLLAYQAGEFVASQYKVGKDLGEKLDEAHVEELLLKRLGVRLTASSAMKAADDAALQRMRELGFDDGANQRLGDGDESEHSEDEATHGR